ncbi:ABC transporter permease [Butyrivibrio hungatei]|uniref:Sugar ABC transporter permease protein n=1 Tax=Butyrivibrio hungatei TaxID=185008 RepID=A0A1D9NYC1_9FIRM|nr:ABC transporter permease subunit [Butyrivibrio hungatei]AOZ95222.1 sugar ABC transporter permease protein [Butyrivibrio hungatei]
MKEKGKTSNFKFSVYMKRYWQLYVMLLLPLTYLLVFKYAPMVYVQIAFKKYSLVESIWKLPVAANHGFEYFIKAFKTNDFKYALRNTLTLNLLDLFLGFPAPIIFALILNELCFARYKKVVQTIAYMPHFLSWVIIYSLALQLLAPNDGLVNMVIQDLGGKAIPFLNEEGHWIGSYIGFGIWQNFGWGSIVYLASIAGINPELYEAAAVDGAGRFRKMWHITLPGIKPTIVVLLIMSLGNILGGGFDRPFAFQNNLVMRVADVIPTFVYRVGIKGLQFSLTTAVGLFQSVVGVFFLLMANFISRKLGERGIW